MNRDNMSTPEHGYLLRSYQCLKLRYRFSALVLASFVLLTLSPLVASSETVLLAPKASGIYAKFHADFKKNLSLLCQREKNHAIAICQSDLRSVRLITQVSSELTSAALVVSLGAQAGEQLANSAHDGPQFYSLIPVSAYQRIEACCLAGQPSLIGALFIDQPLQRQLFLARQLSMDNNHVGVMLSRENQSQQLALEKEARRQGLRISVKIVDGSSAVGPALKSMLAEIDVLLAVPDQLVYNSSTIVNLLLSSYRHHVPVLGYSSAVLNAGATLAIYSEIDQLAAATVAHLLDYYRTQKPVGARYPDDFTLKVNRDVARSLGLRLDSDKALSRSIREMR